MKPDKALHMKHSAWHLKCCALPLPSPRYNWPTHWSLRAAGVLLLQQCSIPGTSSAGLLLLPLAANQKSPSCLLIGVVGCWRRRARDGWALTQSEVLPEMKDPGGARRPVSGRAGLEGQWQDKVWNLWSRTECFVLHQASCSIFNIWIIYCFWILILYF